MNKKEQRKKRYFRKKTDSLRKKGEEGYQIQIKMQNIRKFKCICIYNNELENLVGYLQGPLEKKKKDRKKKNHQKQLRNEQVKEIKQRKTKYK